MVGARRETELNSLVEGIRQSGDEARALAGDVRHEPYAKALVECAIQEYGGLDIALNNAGILGVSGATTDLTLEDWENTLGTNLTSAFLSAKY